jgi:hypothetical protein
MAMSEDPYSAETRWAMRQTEANAARTAKPMTHTVVMRSPVGFVEWTRHSVRCRLTSTRIVTDDGDYWRQRDGSHIGSRRERLDLNTLTEVP